MATAVAMTVPPYNEPKIVTAGFIADEAGLARLVERVGACARMHGWLQAPGAATLPDPALSADTAEDNVVDDDLELPQTPGAVQEVGRTTFFMPTIRNKKRRGGHGASPLAGSPDPASPL